jgi:ureidoglycolate dehydrogenase (NAD+)
MSLITKTLYISAADLAQWVTTALKAVGVPENDARQTAAMLAQTSLWGIDSHGIARSTHYLNRIIHKSIVAAPAITFQQTAAATGQIDGGHGLGFVVCERAMRHAIELARQAGVGVVGVANSSHCGAIGLYTRQATRSGMLGVAFTHSDSFVVPYGGNKAFFGTNPISIAIPTNNPDEPFCVDMATSIVPWNRIMNARRENRSVPLGFGVDATGQDSTDPHLIRAVKPTAEHKGYALAFAIDMLCGPLNNMAFGPHLTTMYEQLEQHRKLGSLMMAIDPQRFAGGPTLAAAVATAISEVKSQKDEILSPGEPEYRMAAKRAIEGIPVEAGLWEEIEVWSTRLKIDPPCI